MVLISNSYLKYGNARNRDELILSFKASKAFCFLPPHWKPFFTLVIACIGVAMEEKLAIKFLQYLAVPKKLLTWVIVLGVGQFKMASTLQG